MYKVLIMGGRPGLEEDLTSALDKNEFNVTSVPDISRATRGLDKSQPDIVILNVESKSTDSWDVCRKLHLKLGIPVIILGKDASENAWVKTVQVGADLYLRRPFGRGELAARVKAILRRYKKP